MSGGSAEKLVFSAGRLTDLLANRVPPSRRGEGYF